MAIKGSFGSNLPVAGASANYSGSGDGLLSDHRAGAQLGRQELVFMPHLGHSPMPAQRSGEGMVERRRSPCEATITASRALRIRYTDNPAAVPAN